ncbi:MAG: carbamoyltransferase HypF, partial [Deltaproteobacteria bacterium]|nr:carbamoyltransferase HypF [Deltaproteobacteria bacterium]
SPVAQDYFKHSAHVLTEYLETTPDLIAVDPHPEYFSTSLAREMNADVIEVFHHHAHAVSLLFEHGIRGPALFAVFDGTGYGTDGSIWGGEFLLADMEHFQRLGHIGIFHLPGGEAAIREPVRILAALLAQAHDGRVPERFVPLMGEHAHRAELWIEAVKKRINAPATSSAGRLFDSAAAAVGFLRPVTFEGQAAMWLESIAKGNTFDPYPVVIEGADPMVVDPAALMVNVADDMLRNCDSGRISARFHATVAMMISQTIGKLAQQTGITTVGLSGGCFQNKLLTEYTLALLEAQKLKVLLHKSIPPNDGGIAVGQAVTAWTRHAGSD